MPRKRIEFKGFIEIEAGVEMDLGYEVTITGGKGEVTGEGKKLVRKASGESTITKTFTVTLDPDETKIGRISAPVGPLEHQAKLASVGADDE